MNKKNNNDDSSMMYNFEHDYFNDDYYYEYYYIDFPNETVSYRHKRQVNQFKELDISLNRHFSKAYFNYLKNHYELNISINFSIIEFNHNKHDNQYILCDLEPVATCEFANISLDHKATCNPKSKVASFFESSIDLIKKVRKNILIAEIKSNEISPLMLNNIKPNFKCSLQPTVKAKMEFNRFTYIFILLNILFLVIIFVLLQKVLFKYNKCCKYQKIFDVEF